MKVKWEELESNIIELAAQEKGCEQSKFKVMISVKNLA